MKVKISIPTELGEIKLSQYQKFLGIVKENEESDFLNHKMVQIFCDIDLSVVDAMKQKDVEDAVNTIGNLFKQLPPLQQRFELNGTTFGFIPNLDDMSAGEYMDLDGYATNWDEMHKAMAVLYRPIKQKLGDKYLIEDYEGTDKYSELMKDAPLNVVLGAMVFFWHLGKELLQSTIHYLEQSPQIVSMNKANLESGGVGILQSMDLLREMLDDSMKSLNFPLTSALPS
jgi:hypothetical protein